MPSNKKNPNFWDILTDIVKEVPTKQIVHKYRTSTATIQRYKEQFIETTVRIKDNVVDDTQMKFNFMLPANRDHSFSPTKEGTFWRRREE